MYELLTPELVTWLETQSREEQSEYLFLEASSNFRGCWEVDSLWPEFYIDFEPIIGSYRLVTPVKLERFLQFASERGYHVLFIEDPTTIIDTYSQYRKTPDIQLNSSLPNTIRGFLPWQIVGYNKLVKDESITAGYVVWDTGAGKTALIASAIKYHSDLGHPFSLALITVKSHNKIAIQRKLLQLAGIESFVLDSYRQDKRYDKYEQFTDELLSGKPMVAITNYEKFREDRDFFKFFFKKRDCLFFWDEMPTKLSNPDTVLYKSVKSALYDSFWSKPRPSWMRHWILSATPIENSPLGVWACINIAWPGLLGRESEFKLTYGEGKNPFNNQPRRWPAHKLERLEAKINFMTHRVSKDDPEVAKMFPEELEIPTPIDWNPKHAKIYDKLTGKASDLLEEFQDANILSMIQVMQMMCDAPSMIRESAKNREHFWELLGQYGDMDPGDIPIKGPKGSEIATTLLSVVSPSSLTDVGHAKLEMWREIICDKHPGEKIITHSTWAEYIFPVWEHWLQKWGVTYVLYAGTDKQKQQALDRFRQDPDIQMFLSGDSGSDSIDIPEARVGINYNIPWKWTTLTQRSGRRDRVDSTFDTIFTYSLIMPGSVDERKLEVCERKRGYHAALFDGIAYDESISAGMSRAEMIYLLTGYDAS